MAGYTDPSGANTIVEFGITPYFVLNDVSGTVVGDGVVLVGGDKIAVDISNITFDIQASKLNAFIMDTSDGLLTLCGLASLVPTDFATLETTDVSLNVFKQFISESYKATIAKRITGKFYGDIGTLENDTVFTGDALVTNDTLTAMKTAIKNAIMDQSDSLIVAAEDILRDLELSDASGSTTGRDTNAPFVAGDILLFNCLVKNGNIELFLNDVASLTDSSNNTTFFETQGDEGRSLGLLGFATDISTGGGIVVNENNNSNVYIYTDSATSTRFTSINRVFEPQGAEGTIATREGYVEFESGAVLIRMAIKVIPDPVV
jgi:hypothetical protein